MKYKSNFLIDFALESLINIDLSYAYILWYKPA